MPAPLHSQDTEVSPSPQAEAPSPIAELPLAFQLLPLVEWWQSAIERNARALAYDLGPRSLGVLIVHIIRGERRPIRLAETLGISRQAVHQMIQQLVKSNRLSIVPDPDDGRATIVIPTEELFRSGTRTIAILNAIEKRMEKKFGARKFAMFKAMASEDWGPVPIVRKQEVIGDLS